MKDLLIDNYWSFEPISNGHEKCQAPFGVVKETWIYVPNSCFFGYILRIVSLQIEIERILCQLSLLVHSLIWKDVDCN